jgi:hypothetical protein
LKAQRLKAGSAVTFRPLIEMLDLLQQPTMNKLKIPSDVFRFPFSKPWLVLIKSDIFPLLFSLLLNGFYSRSFSGTQNQFSAEPFLRKAEGSDWKSFI